MNLIKFLYRHSRVLLLLATLTSILAGLSGAALVGIISQGVAQTGASASAALMFFGFCLLYLACKSFSEISLLNITQSAIFELRVSLSYRLLRTPLKKLQELGAHGLLPILTRDVDTFIYAFQLFPIVLGNTIIILACLGYMAWLSWQIFLMLAVTLAVCLYVYSHAEQRPMKQLVKVREQMDILYRDFRNLIEGSKELQLNARRGNAFIEKVIAPGALASKTAFTKSMTGYAWVMNTGTLLFYVVIGIVLFVVPLWLPQPPATLISLTFILLYLIRPIGEMMQALPPLRGAAIALGRIQQLDDSLPSASHGEADHATFAETGAPLLTLSGVAHQYPAATEDSHFTLGPLDLTIRKGEIVFVVGGNGCGKTTLAMLLLGLYEPEQGSVALNGVPVTAANRDAYRQHFSAVFAEFHLFEQLLEADSPALLKQAEDYVARLQMSHKVKIANGKFSTIDLSSGQRKRLALVSSYLEDRPIYLFDEWAADQDPAFKRVFYTELLPDLKARGKTVIAITHDDAYFSYADRVIKLVDGRMSEMLPPARQIDKVA